MPTSSRRRPGRPEGRPDGRTRQEIVETATRQFAARGFERTSLRSIADEAGVDPSLITHYMGTKQNLFVEAVRLPFDPAAVVQVVSGGDPDSAGRRLVGIVMEVLESPAGRSSLLGLIRAATSHPDAAALLRERLARDVLAPIATRLGHCDPELRVSLVMSQVVGLVMARYVIAVEPLSSISADAVMAALAPTLQRYLTADLTADLT